MLFCSWLKLNCTLPEFLDLREWIQLFERLLECGQFTRDYTGRDPLERLPLLKLTFVFLEGLIVLILICSHSLCDGAFRCARFRVCTTKHLVEEARLVQPLTLALCCFKAVGVRSEE